ncbi:carbohydrate-binding family 9-like protein [Paenibacillus aceris]|uniref:Carbohydrate-binding domain-containing protein n=1 Tax=Paenibacillus aceris TaxID=869555 RepID=A0ABS4HYI0_9BACL|nr:carbohydrate-binding family 9-like protein [Paenibacillus aceris]MBP1963615.1 hypothetical protein [Paenibacillus aceris]NHW36876.1 hypothetical protein [Paenibacillus aceris]
MRYECRYITAVNGLIPWDEIAAGTLVEVVTGGKPRLETRFRACWTADALHVRFDCEDDHVVATMEQRDDPIYEEDVVEVFLDIIGTGKVYYEFELSPRGVEFDALIHNRLNGHKEVDVAWDAKGLHTAVSDGVDGWKHYELRIPFADLLVGREEERVPRHGVRWGWNLYRIDDDIEGNRHYWAWSPTGKVNFHIPQRFGTLVFVSE